jgi:SAM-dependent methyltransferase
LPNAAQRRSLLDVCCGTGQLARDFLDNGYRVIGLDASKAMLRQAAANNEPYTQSESGQAQFVQGDAANFALDEKVDIVVSTYDSLNHLSSIEALHGCFRSAWNTLTDDGMFLFDLNTRHGMEGWQSTAIEDSLELMFVSRGQFDPTSGQASLHVTGFVRTENGLYERFEEIAYNTLFDLDQVRQLLVDDGWQDVYLAATADLTQPAADPERERRIFFIARKSRASTNPR